MTPHDWHRDHNRHKQDIWERVDRFCARALPWIVIAAMTAGVLLWGEL